MRPGERAQLGRQREGQQEVCAREQAGALPLEPALGLLAVALGTVAIATGVLAVVPRAAVITRLHVPPQRRRAADRDVAQGARRCEGSSVVAWSAS
jgi:hypothetical protein